MAGQNIGGAPINLGGFFGNLAGQKQGKYLGQALTGLKNTEQARFDPYAAAGTGATSLISSLLGLGGGTAGAEGLDKFRESTGFQDTQNAALNGVTSNAAARGLLGSSGTGKVFQTTAANLAQGSFGDFLKNLMNQQSVGLDAAGAQANVGATLGSKAAEGTAKSKGGIFGALGGLFGGG